ncbi:hypothetical protein D3C78_681300 [compost metagenome]
MGLVDAQFPGDAGDHGGVVAGQQQGLPATGAAGLQQGGRIVTDAIIEHDPGERAGYVAQQKPLSRFVGQRRGICAAESADEGGLANA